MNLLIASIVLAVVLLTLDLLTDRSYEASRQT
jgi:hypothetical protein